MNFDILRSIEQETNTADRAEPAADARNLDRRRFLGRTLAAGAGALATPHRFSPASPADDPHILGKPRRPYGFRSRFESHVVRSMYPMGYPTSASAHTPLEDLHGIVTPAALHFERIHAGVPTIAPWEHRLLIHGLVDRPLVFSMDDLHRMPTESRMHFIECAGNSEGEQDGPPGRTPAESHGLLSCSEWTGVPLSFLMAQVGVKPSARWVLAEGADACHVARSLPVQKALEDVIVAFAQNGEALRPEQGYPVRLLVPGWEGNVNIKWVRRLEFLDQPAMTAWETAWYTDLMPNGKARRFTFVMEAKSVVVRPAGGQRLDRPGVYEISGLAWSGRGRITRVDVSTDGGRNWHGAQLQTPVLPKAWTRFRLPWTWNGQPALIASRCMDETGYQQPTRQEILAVRGVNATDHYNGIKWWRVHRNGEVTYE